MVLSRFFTCITIKISSIAIIFGLSYAAFRVRFQEQEQTRTGIGSEEEGEKKRGREKKKEKERERKILSENGKSGSSAIDINDVRMATIGET